MTFDEAIRVLDDLAESLDHSFIPNGESSPMHTECQKCDIEKAVGTLARLVTTVRLINAKR